MFPGETILTKPEGERRNPHFSEFKVIRSNQWYIGTMFLSCGVANCKECGEYNEHGRGQRKAGDELDYNSRETDYFNNEQEAKDALEVYKKTGELPNQRY